MGASGQPTLGSVWGGQDPSYREPLPVQIQDSERQRGGTQEIIKTGGNPRKSGQEESYLLSHISLGFELDLIKLFEEVKYSHMIQNENITKFTVKSSFPLHPFHQIPEDSLFLLCCGSSQSH